MTRFVCVHGVFPPLCDLCDVFDFSGAKAARDRQERWAREERNAQALQAEEAEAKRRLARPAPTLAEQERQWIIDNGWSGKQ